VSLILDACASWSGTRMRASPASSWWARSPGGRTVPALPGARSRRHRLPRAPGRRLVAAVEDARTRSGGAGDRTLPGLAARTPRPPRPFPSTAAGQASSPVIAPSPRELALPARRRPEAGSKDRASCPVPPPASSDDVRLTAISQKDGRPVVLINDRLMFEGDSFDGVKVLRIGEAEVEVEVRASAGRCASSRPPRLRRPAPTPGVSLHPDRDSG